MFDFVVMQVQQGTRNQTKLKLGQNDFELGRNGLEAFRCYKKLVRPKFLKQWMINLNNYK